MLMSENTSTPKVNVNIYGVRAYEENSLEGLIPQKTGPKGPTTPWKITPPIRELIWELAAKEPGLTQKEIAKRVEEEFQVKIHWTGVGRALSVYRQQQRQTDQNPSMRLLKMIPLPRLLRKMRLVLFCPWRPRRLNSRLP